MKRLLIVLIVILPVFCYGQQPKMHIKAFGGFNTAKLVYKVEGLKSNVLSGWQTGMGFRVMHRRAFVELDFVYRNYGITLHPNEDATIVIDEPIDIRIKALEFPLSMGYVAVKKPVFKWFLYGGLVSRFSLKGNYEYKGEKDTFKPKELDLHTYNLGARFGTQFDLAMFNFDFSYTIGITNAFKNRARTNTHGLNLSAGFIF